MLMIERNIRRELPINGARRHSQNPRRGVRHRAGLRPRVPGRGHDHDPILHRMERTNGNAIPKVITRIPTDRHRKHINPIVDCSIHGGDDVSVVAGAAGWVQWPANLVSCDAGSRRSALGGAVGVAEEIGAGDEGAGGGGESVSAVAVGVSGWVEAGFERVPRRRRSRRVVAFVEVSGSDQLPVNKFSNTKFLGGMNANVYLPGTHFEFSKFFLF